MTQTTHRTTGRRIAPAAGRPWWQRTGVVLLPLRLFLGMTFVYAALVKLWDPAYLDATSPQSVQAQMHQFAHTSPIGPLVSLAAAHAGAAGLAIAIGELAVGVGALLGIWTRLAAAGGLLLAVSFWLTVSWQTRPYFYGSDIVFAFAWLTVLLAGDGGVASLGALIASSVRGGHPGMLDPDEQAELDRRVLLRTGGVAAAAGAVALAAGGLTAWLGRHSAAASTAETSGGATSGSAPDPSPSPSTSPSAAQTPAASASGAASAPPPGTAVGRASAVPVGRALRTRDPRTKQPVWVVHTRKGFKAFSAVCTHAGCTVDFQRSSTQFACPCHGARYDATNGHVLAGPAPDPLPPLRVEVVDGEIRLL